MTPAELYRRAVDDLVRWRQQVLLRVPLHRLNLLVFFGALVSGLLFIRIVDPSDVSPTFYVGGMILIMGVYLGFCLLFMTRVPGAEDYVYYMGFLFTLVGLAAALFKVTQTRNTDIIIGYFGLAVTSTIIGVAYRVILILMHRDPETTIQLELVEAAGSARDLNQELKATNAELKATNAAFSKLRKQSEKGLADLGTRMVSDTQAVAQELQTISKKFSEQLARQMEDAALVLTASTEAMQRDLQASSASLHDQMAGHAKHLADSMATAAETVPQHIQAVFGRVGEEMETTARRVAENVVASAEALPNELHAISTRLGEEAERNFSEVTRQVAAVAQSLSQALQKVYEDLRQQTERHAGEVAAAMTAYAEPLSKGLEDVADHLAGVGRNIRDEGQSAARGLEELKVAVAGATASLQQLRHPEALVEVQFAPLSASLEDTVDSLKRVIDSHARQMREVEEAIAAWHRAEKTRSHTVRSNVDRLMELFGAGRRRSWWRRLFTIGIILAATLLATDSLL